MTQTAICLAWLRALLKRSRAEKRDLKAIQHAVQVVARAEAEEGWAEMEKQGVPLAGAVDWEDIPW